MDSTTTALIITQSVTFCLLITGEIYPFTYGPIRAFLGLILSISGRPPTTPTVQSPLIVQSN